jgi:hypothetical protein
VSRARALPVLGPHPGRTTNIPRVPFILFLFPIAIIEVFGLASSLRRTRMTSLAVWMACSMSVSLTAHEAGEVGHRHPLLRYLKVLNGRPWRHPHTGNGILRRVVLPEPRACLVDRPVRRIADG